MRDEELDRYSRQILVPEIGFDGQENLSQASICLVGAGGLGSLAASYLAGAGVGDIHLIDSDVIELSNLHRQLFFTEANLGQPKVKVLADHLRSLNNLIRITPHHTHVDGAQMSAILAEVQPDLVVDGSDNFGTRFAVNQASVSHKIPLIFGAVEQRAGQVGFLNPPDSGCYACLFPSQLTDGGDADARGCDQFGVLGPMVGQVASTMAHGALLLLAERELAKSGHLRGGLIGSIHSFEGLQQRAFVLGKDPSCTVCQHLSGG